MHALRESSYLAESQIFKASCKVTKLFFDDESRSQIVLEFLNMLIVSVNSGSELGAAVKVGSSSISLSLGEEDKLAHVVVESPPVVELVLVVLRTLFRRALFLTFSFFLFILLAL